jgi:hypothetical protein
MYWSMARADMARCKNACGAQWAEGEISTPVTCLAVTWHTHFPPSLPSPLHLLLTLRPRSPLSWNGRHTVLICGAIRLFEPRPSSDKYETATHFQLDTHCFATSHRLQQQHLTLCIRIHSTQTTSISPITNASKLLDRRMRGRVPAENNGHFDSKVSSRQYADVWEENNKFRLGC